jgi:hypothetical protein
MQVLPNFSSRIKQVQHFFEVHVNGKTHFQKKSLRETDFNPVVANVLTAGAWLPPTTWESGDPPLDLRDHWKVPKLVESSMKGLTCYITGSCCFGMGPDCIRKGDVLVSTTGASSIIALRPFNRNAVYQPLKHNETTMTVVGDCYVHWLQEFMQQQDQKHALEYRIV